ncbi:sulfite exporter TauE/SafE family protein [Butyrivibrio sp.]|uniref:urease accessory protein UreH domain-containing protein n=1 Tax=Butyrivibrio sp. TaxID=28121 RepID=UPI0025B8B47D|nr:sulfite exporter TauE/SafE family protein [Butyrivibrio sp.]MBQ9303211.1 sulfite exporter TauE/SafE family protein [Butyrivibrio sp.]
MMKKINLKIGGMTCIQCQTKIEKALKKVNGVRGVSVSYSKGTADVEYDDAKISLQELKKVIEKLDYKVLDKGDGAGSDVLNSISLLALIVVLFSMLQRSGILNYLVPDRLAESGMGYVMLFLIGLMTSVHCIAMCGGIGVSQSLPKKGELKTFLRPLSYNLGRVCSYTIIGFVLGGIGSLVSGNAGLEVSYFWQGLLKIVAGLFMVIMGLNMLEMFPWLRKFNIHTPMAITKLIGSKKVIDRGPFAVGLLNGLMPCGPLQAMWLVAMAAGNPFTGALSMLAFSLGTVPLMLGFGSVFSLLGKKYTRQIMRIGAVFVAVMGLALISQGGSLSGLVPAVRTESVATTNESVNKESTENVTEIVEEPSADSTQTVIEGVQIEDGVQIVNSTLTRGRYPEITVQAGVPVRWHIEAPQGALNGCNAMMVIPDYGIQYAFNYGDNVIEFTPEKAGLVSYSCWMGMVYGSINVID